MKTFKFTVMKKIVYCLFLFVLASCAGSVEDIGTDVSTIQTRSAGTENFPNYWNILNASMSGDTMFYDLVYSNTEHQTYACYSLYTLFLYKGAYDGYYGGYSIGWNYDWRTGLYQPETIPAEYGVVIQEWDECLEDGETARFIPYNETYSRRRGVHLAPGKTLDDIEYVLFFLYDNKNFSILGRLDRYVDDCTDFYAE